MTREVSAVEASNIASRVRVHRSEQLCVGATRPQVDRLAALKAPGPARLDPPEQKRLEGLFALYERAPAGPEQQRAARPLFDAARDLGARLAKADEVYAADVRSVFSARQWKLLNYQKLGPSDSEAIPATFAGPPAGAANDRGHGASAGDDEGAGPGQERIPNPLSLPAGIAGVVAMAAAVGIYIWRRRSVH
jgi:hypothetical protein